MKKKAYSSFKFNCRTIKYLKKYRFYPLFMYNKLDKWLAEMSRNGWHIVHCNIFTFWFEHGNPANKEYFTYAEFSQKGKYSITLLHPFFERRYGLKTSKSKINSNHYKKYEILEIDTDKVDTRNDVGYNELLNDRNRLYFKYLTRNISAIIIFSMLIIIINLFIN